jgi:hypothetical protein
MALSQLHQTYLGSSAQNRLIIIDNKNTTRDGDKCIPRDEAFIFRLPDELLVKVLGLATSQVDTRRPWWYCECEMRCDYAATKTLALVCHRFNRIVLPLLYRTIRFGHSHRIVPPAKAVKSLHRTLQKNPSLSQHCRALSISINDLAPHFEGEDFSIALDFVSWMKKVRCLKVHGGFDKPYNEHTWALIRKIVQDMREIEHLCISREGWGLYLGPIMEQVDIPRLKKLHVHGISEMKDKAVVLEPKVFPIFH